MGNFMLINACYGKLFIESYFVLKEKMNSQVHMTYLKKAFIYFLTKSSQMKILFQSSRRQNI